MKIIYNDEVIEEVCDILYDFINNVNLDLISKEDYGMRRCRVDLFKKEFNKRLYFCDMEIGNKVVHAHGIGNNNKYPIYHTVADDYKEICGYININSGLYSEIYVYISDYNNIKYDNTYHITPKRKMIKNH